MITNPRTRIVAVLATLSASLTLGAVLVPEVAHASTDIASCASVVQNALVNPGFESPAIGTSTYRIMPEASMTGWHTTASDHMVEAWSTGFQGVASPQGNQFAELNANMVGMLYQDVATIPGTTITWRIAHRGRSGVDKMDVKVGPPSGTLLSQSGGVGYSDGTTAWVYHGGTYMVPVGQTVTRFGFDSISSVGGVSYGNFLDVTAFGVTTLLACPDTAATHTGQSVSDNAFANDLSATSLSVSAYTQPAHGSVSMTTAGVYTYTPATGYTGNDTFTYTVVNPQGNTATTNVSVSVTNLALPSFDNGTTTDTVSVIGGGPAVPGATVQFSITKTNSGTDTATQAVVRETVPSGLTYVPGSLTVVSGTSTPTGVLSDAATDDRGYWTGSAVAVNVGTGATATSGGSMAPGASVTISYRATIAAGQIAPVAPTATIEYVALLLNRPIAEAGNTVTVPVVNPATLVTTTTTAPATTTTTAPTTTTTTVAPSGSFTIVDAGLGSGATCPATLNEDRPAPVDLSSVEQFTQSTSIFTSNFGGGSAPGFQQLSGNWLVAGGAYTQQNTCGFDYTSILTTHALEHFGYSVTFHATAANQGGIVFNQTSDITRSGASVVDLSAGGSVLRWGHYDAAGYYRKDGSVSVTTVAPGQSVTIAVVAHSSTAAISYNGTQVATMTNVNPRGYVGLVTNQSKVLFDSVALTGLPAV